MLLLNLSNSSKDYANSFHMHGNDCSYSISMPLVLNLLAIGHVQHSSSLDATQSIVLIKNYTVFQNDAPAIFYCNGSGYENGAVVGWILNRTGYGLKQSQMGITYVTAPSEATEISSRLFIPSNSAINNNTEVKCKSIDSISNTVQMSEPAYLTIQGECCTTL